MKIAAVTALALGVALGAAQAQQPEEATSPAIEDGSRVEIEYSFTDNSGSDLGSNKGREPLAFIQGQREILPALENALIGMRVGEETQVTVSPADAYGELDPNAVTEIPRDRIPAESLTVGTDLVLQGENGESRSVRITEIREDTVVVDLNHPLAGKTLVFDLKVLGVKPPAK